MRKVWIVVAIIATVVEILFVALAGKQSDATALHEICVKLVFTAAMFCAIDELLI